MSRHHADDPGPVAELGRFDGPVSTPRHLLPILPIVLSAALLNAWVAPHLQAVAAVDVFWATVVWSLGVAVSTCNLMLARDGGIGIRAVAAGMLLSLLGAAYLATQIGLGAYSTPPPAGGFTEWEAVAFATTQAWGLLGAMLGAVAGVLAGRLAVDVFGRERLGRPTCRRCR